MAIRATRISSGCFALGKKKAQGKSLPAADFFFYLYREGIASGILHSAL
jgi:hypothetical protein